MKWTHSTEKQTLVKRESQNVEDRCEETIPRAQRKKERDRKIGHDETWDTVRPDWSSHRLSFRNYSEK